ncbi:MAG: hypothetical protein U0Z75_09665 [Deinococcaceae bacterium]
MKNIYFGIVAAGLALLASSCGKSSSSIAPVMAAQAAGPVFYPSNNSEYADFLGAGVLQSLPTASSKLVPITIAPTSGASIVSLKVSSSNPSVATVTAEGNKLGGNVWNIEVWPKSMGTTNLTLTAVDSNSQVASVQLTYTVIDKPQITAIPEKFTLTTPYVNRCISVKYGFELKIKSLQIPDISVTSTNGFVAWTTPTDIALVSVDGLNRTYRVNGVSNASGTSTLAFSITDSYGTTVRAVPVTRSC